MKLLLVAAVWVVATLCSLLALVAAYLGRADWGDGGASQMPVVEATGLVALAALAPAVAWWLTRRVLR